MMLHCCLPQEKLRPPFRNTVMLHLCYIVKVNTLNLHLPVSSAVQQASLLVLKNIIISFAPRSLHGRFRTRFRFPLPYFPVYKSNQCISQPYFFDHKIDGTSPIAHHTVLTSYSILTIPDLPMKTNSFMFLSH